MLRVVFILIASYQFTISTDFLTAQTNHSASLDFAIHRVYPSLVLTSSELATAKTLTDLNHRFESDWVKEYLSVELTTQLQGKSIKTIGQDINVTAEQKQALGKADVGSPISVKVKYIPDNTLSDNDAKFLEFSIIPEPVISASFPGGEESMSYYLLSKAINTIPSHTFQGYDLAAITFSIDESGEVVNAKIFDQGYGSSPSKTIDSLLLSSIAQMPCWSPAEYHDGTKAKQDFILTVGNMQNCIFNTFNINKNGKPHLDANEK